MTRRGASISLVFSFAAALAIAGLSQLLVPSGSGDGIVSLSWRTEAARIEECRTLSEEELSRVAPHMRRSEECVGGTADYQLRLSVGDLEPWVDTIAPSGLRRDRPVYVLHDQLVPPGRYPVSVTFEAILPGSDASEVGALSWSGDVDLARNQIVLITLDADGRDLVVRASAPR